MRVDKITGGAKGMIKLDSCKGGKDREIAVSVSTYDTLKNHIAQNGGEFVLRNEENKYRESLKLAALASNQKYCGSHGLRWNFAHTRHHECMMRRIMTYEQALSQVSSEMGHERADITLHYLR